MSTMTTEKTSVKKTPVKNQKSSTDFVHETRIKKSLDYIENHLLENIRASDIANASHFSENHFQRIFRSLVGETVNEYVTRRRLEHAANLLIYNKEKSISDISVHCNYSSNANFAKAFKKHFGIKPSLLREQNPEQHSSQEELVTLGRIRTKYGKKLDIQSLHPASIEKEILVYAPVIEAVENLQVIALPPINIVYVMSERGYEVDSILAAWTKIKQWARDKGVCSDFSDELSCFSMSHDNPYITPHDRCRYDTAVVVPENIPMSSLDIKTPFFYEQLPASQYISIRFKGKCPLLSEVYKDLISRWMPENNYQLGDIAPLEHCFYFSKEKNETDLALKISINPRG